MTALSVCACVGEIRDVPLILCVSLLTPCLDSEKLCIAVDLMKGMFLVSLAQKGPTFLYVVLFDCSEYFLFSLLHLFVYFPFYF